LGNVSDDYQLYLKDQSLWENIDERENYRVLTPSTPSNYFHALRRQLVEDFRKPAFLLKSEYVIKNTSSHSDEFLDNKEFQKVILDYQRDLKTAEKVIFCHGDFYYQLKARL
jgi:2-oxoglutarate dehydrogenase E1 component